MCLRNTLRTGLLAAVCLAWLAPARAAEVDKLLPNDTEILVTINVRQILDSPLVKKYALDKHAGKKQTTINKDVQGLIAKEDAKQSVWAVVLSSALRKSSVASNDEKVKEILGKFRSFSAGLTVTDEVRLEANIAAKDDGAANDLKKELTGGLEQAKGLAAVFAANQPQLAPLSDVLDSIKVDADKNSVVLKFVLPDVEGKVNTEVGKVVRLLGLNPVKEISAVTFATPGGSDAAKWLGVVSGEFDPARIQSAVDQFAKGRPDAVAVHQQGA